MSIKFVGVVGDKGGPGSGNWGHAGRPGLRGGSGKVGVMHSPGGITASEADVKKGQKVAGDILSGNLQHWALASTSERINIRKAVASDLSERTGVDVEDTASLVDQWVKTSNDNDMRSLAVQRDAAKEFGVELSDWQQGKIDEVETALAKQPAESRPMATRYNPLLPSDTQQSILRAMYDNTQEAFKSQGLGPNDTVRLYRGTYFPPKVASSRDIGDIVNYEGNAIESWTVSLETANRFSNATVAMDVPVRNIVSSARTGSGCVTEGEFVILGTVPGQQARVERIW